jgi:hypothetical protein
MPEEQTGAPKSSIQFAIAFISRWPCASLARDRPWRDGGSALHGALASYPTFAAAVRHLIPP